MIFDLETGAAAPIYVYVCMKMSIVKSETNEGFSVISKARTRKPLAVSICHPRWFFSIEKGCFSQVFCSFSFSERERETWTAYLILKNRFIWIFGFQKVVCFLERERPNFCLFVCNQFNCFFSSLSLSLHLPIELPPLTITDSLSLSI